MISVIFFFFFFDMHPDSLEVYDSGWGPPDEEPPLQANSSAEHTLSGSKARPADRDAAAEQAAWAVGTAQLPAANHL